MSRITVLTNMKPTNVGNQALSTELLRLVKRSRPGEEVFAIGRSGGLKHVTSHGAAPTDAPALIEQWADELVRAARAASLPAQRSYQGEIIPLVRRSKARVSIHRWTRRLRIRARISDMMHRFGMDKRDVAQQQHSRARLMGESRIAIYNPAGELNPHAGSFDVVLRSLVEMLAASRMGARTYVVNHSVEFSDRFAEEAVAYIYSRMTGIIVRDQSSRAELERVGVPAERIRVVPDIAFLTEPSASDRALKPADQLPDKQLVGLAINYWDATRNEAGWTAFVSEIRRQGSEVIFVSNALGQDLAFAKRLQQACGIRIQTYDYDYDTYCALLGKLRLVVTNRLHTGVFAYVAGTPVVPVEANQFKVTSLFQEIRYPLAAINTTSSSWPQQLLTTVASANADTLRTQIASDRTALRREIEREYASILADA